MDQTKQDNHTLSVTQKKSLLKSALNYAKLGFKVFPCEPKGKAPLGALVPHGHLDATLNPKLIKHWYRMCPTANVGLVPPEGYAVIDVDPRDGGLDTLKSLGKGTGTLKAFSGGLDRGHHLWYRYAPHSLPGSLGKGIQLKANGHGYVVAPPSIHPDGGIYAWDGDFDPERISRWPKGLGGDSNALAPNAKHVEPGDASGDNTLTLSQVKEILGKISPDDYHVWIKVGQALQNGYEDQGLTLWSDWSKTTTRTNFKVKPNFERKWRTFKGSGVTLGTLVYMAGGKVPKASPEEEFTKVEGPGEEDGPWAKGWKERSGNADDLMDETPKLKSGLVVTELSSKTEKAIDWLVPGYFAKGMLHCIAGFGGDGKSSVCSAILSSITNGRSLLNDSPLPGGPISVLIATEEPIEQQTLPRLKLAGADISRIKLLEGVREKDQVVAWNLADHLDKARKYFKAFPELQLFEIDPIGNYMEGRKRKRDMNSWNDTDVRMILGPWQKLAEELNICIVFLAHFNKGKAIRAVEKVMGSAAFTTTTRFTYLVGKPGADFLEPFGYAKSELGEDRVLLSIKRNIGRDPSPIVFGIETHNGDVDGNPKVTVKGVLPRGLGGELEQAIMGGDFKAVGGTVPRNVDRVLEVIEKANGITRRQIAEQTGIQEDNISKHLNELEDKIEKIRNGKEVWVYIKGSPLLSIFS